GIQPEYSYQWSVTNGVILTDPTTNFVQVDWDTSLPSGTIEVFISNGCNSKTEMVTTQVVYPNVFEMSGPDVVCPNEITVYEVENLTDPGAEVTYIWDVSPPASILAGQNTDAVTILWGSNPSGEVMLDILGFCDLENMSIEVTEFIPAQIDIAGPTESCEGSEETYVLTGPVPAGAEILWEFPANALPLSDPSLEFFEIKWVNASGGTISVSFDDCSGNPVSSNIEVTVSPAGVSDTLVVLCPGTCFVYDGTEYCTEGNYTLEETATGGCPNILELTLQFLDQPDVVADAGVDVTVGCTVPRVLDGSGSLIPEGAEIGWYDPNGNLIANDTTVTIQDAGDYAFEVYNPVTQCFDSDIVTVSPAVPPVSDAGPDQWINCFNNNMVSIGPGNAQSLDYDWVGPNGFTSQEPNPVVTEGGIYQLIVSDSATGCGSDTASVEVFEGYTVDISATQSFCDEIDGTAFVNTTGISDPIFEWSNGSTIPDPVGLAPGIYTVTISSVNGSCEEILSAEVTADLSCKVLIGGFVVDDGEEGDCELGNGTIPSEGIEVTLAPLGITTFTDAEGYYEFLVDTGEYVLSVDAPEPYFVLCPGFGTLEVSLLDTADVSLENHFFLDYLTNFDLYVTAYANTPKPGLTQNFQVTYCNNFVQTINGRIELVHDENLEFDPEENNASGYDPETNTAYWLYAGLSFFECEYLNFSLNVPADIPPGTVVTSTVIGRPLLGDIAPQNNTVVITKTVPSNDPPPPSPGESVTNQKQSFEVYPNPTNDWIQVSIPDLKGYFLLELYSISGQRLFVREEILGDQNVEMNLRSDSRPGGLYLVKLTSERGEIFSRRVLLR
ncbi:MAG: T9SS type A sorting domain-containing protein, partial [Saprospiraceae bacterium]|nr:T9SS type A sorting domain-containing protein [Saprospiraceae bacterium]